MQLGRTSGARAPPKIVTRSIEEIGACERSYQAQSGQANQNPAASGGELDIVGHSRAALLRALELLLSLRSGGEQSRRMPVRVLQQDKIRRGCSQDEGHKPPNPGPSLAGGALIRSVVVFHHARNRVLTNQTGRLGGRFHFSEGGRMAAND
jgi:hypothetical protein